MPEIRGRSELTPVRIASGLFGNPNAVCVSPRQGMLLNADGDERLVRAVHLARLPGGKVRQAFAALRPA